MSKTDWNSILGHYKKGPYPMQDVVVFAQLKPIFVAMGGLEKSDDGD